MRIELIVVESVDEHREAQALIHSLIASERPQDIARLRAQALLVADWEARRYPPLPPDPIAAIKFRIDQLGLSAHDTAVLFGGHASEVLSGRRRPSLAMIRKLHRALGIPYDVLLGAPDQQGVEGESSFKPAVPLQESISPGYVVCLEDGRKLKMLKRHLKTVHNFTPDEYRARWGLPPEYPMVAPEYAHRRSELANEIGLGRAGGRRKPAGRRGAG